MKALAKRAALDFCLKTLAMLSSATFDLNPAIALVSVSCLRLLEKPFQLGPCNFSRSEAGDPNHFRIAPFHLLTPDC